MKLSINQAELANALTIVRSGISSRPSLPILSGVCFKAYNNVLTLQTTDLKSSVQFKINALVEEEGEAVIPAKLLGDIVKTLADAAVHISTDEDQAHILCDAASFALKTMPAEDFPAFPNPEPEERITIKFDTFARMIKRVARVASKDESRAILTGILLSKEGTNLKMVATDSYRLAITEAESVAEGSEDFEAVIESNFLQQVASLPSVEEDIQLALSENQIIITHQDTIFINRRIEGNYPNYRQLLPDSYETRVEYNTQALSTAVKRTSLLASPTSPLRFDVNVETQTTQLSTVAKDVGTAQEIIRSEIEGTDIEIAFNYNYVLDGLNAAGTDKIYLELQSPMKPGIFKSSTEDKFLYLIMPVRIQA